MPVLGRKSGKLLLHPMSFTPIIRRLTGAFREDSEEIAAVLNANHGGNLGDRQPRLFNHYFFCIFNSELSSPCAEIFAKTVDAITVKSHGICADVFGSFHHGLVRKPVAFCKNPAVQKFCQAAAFLCRERARLQLCRGQRSLLFVQQAPEFCYYAFLTSQVRMRR